MGNRKRESTHIGKLPRLSRNFFGESVLKKWLFCRWFHETHRCFPEVWDRGLEGPWHCGKCHPCNEGLQNFEDSINRAEKLKRLHAGSPREKSYRVRIPRKFLKFLTRYTKVYLTVYKEDSHWHVLITNRADCQERAWGAVARGVDFRTDNGEIYQESGLSGAWESIISMWPVEEEDKVAEVFSHVAKMVDLAYEQHIGS